MRDFLAGLLARFQAADRQQRLYVALGVVVAVFVLRFGVTWLSDYRAEVKSDIQLSARRLANARELLGQGEVVRERLDSLRARYAQLVSELVPGSTPTLAAAALQDRVSDLARDHNVRIQSTQVLKQEELGPFTEVALRVTAQGGIGNLAFFLGQLEFGPPRVEVEFAEFSRRASSVRRRRRKDKQPDRERLVSVTLQINAISQASASAPSAPPAAPAAPPARGRSADPDRPAVPDNPLGTTTSPPGGRV